MSVRVQSEVNTRVRVLLVEDDRLIRRGLAEVLTDEGYEVVEAFDGDTALALFHQRPMDVVCLDIMMPRTDGYEVCRRIRAVDAQVPILFISAKSEEIDKVLGLELGADDFIVKPFGVKEVVARVRAVLRRAAATRPRQETQFRMDDLEVYPREFRARRDAQIIDLSPRDVQILRLLFERRGQAVDRLSLFRHAWGVDYLPNSRTLDQHISQLRKRVEVDASQPRIILTVHGVGYRFD